MDGQGGTLGADLSAFEIGADLRMNLGALLVPRLSLLRPIAGIRSGLLVRMVGSSVLVDDASNTIPGAKDETNALPFVALSGGLEYRFGPSLVFGVMGDYAYAGESYQATSLLAELGWLKY